MDGIKVVWICHFSNAEMRQKLCLKQPWLQRIGRRLIGRPNDSLRDFASWVTKAIREFEKFDDVDLHVIAPAPYLRKERVDYTQRNVNYHFFRDEGSTLFGIVRLLLFKNIKCEYKHNRARIMAILNEVSPRIVHTIGAENPYYSLSLMDVPKSMKTILQLQTLMSDPDFFANYPMSRDEYNYRSDVEKQLILRADYVGTVAKKYIDIIHNTYPQVRILQINLPFSEEVFIDIEVEKKYDFVYFAVDISKAVDDAIESFAIASLSHPGISMDIIGGCSMSYKEKLMHRLNELGINDQVTFEGLLPTHEDVLRQIRKSRFALLPLKVDITSGTIREAMANGLPVVTTDTGELGTRKINSKNECVLIAPKGDYEAMALLMSSLLDNPSLAGLLRNNAAERMQSRKSNNQIMDEWRNVYHSLIID